MSDNPDNDADVQLEPQPEPSPTAAATSALVFIMETALRDVNAHAAEEPQYEIGGILVGSVTEGERPVVLVEAAIRGEKMAHARGSVTFTHETWNEINAVKDSQYPDLKIVGWYHSHPGFGLFLSGHDLFIHKNFFSAPWQIAVVADPLAKSWGCFTWQGQDLAQDPQVHTVAVQWSPGDPPAANSEAPAPPPQPVILPPPAPAPRDRGVVWALGVLGLLLALLIGIAVANYHDLGRLRTQVQTLNQQVSALSHELTVVRDRVLDLSAPAPAPAPPAATPAPTPLPPGSATPPAPAPGSTAVPPARPAPGATP